MSVPSVLGAGSPALIFEAVDEDVLAVVEVEVPEGGVEEVEGLEDLDVALGVGDVGEARAGDVEVFGFVVGFVAGPEIGSQKGSPDASNGAVAGDAEVVACSSALMRAGIHFSWKWPSMRVWHFGKSAMFWEPWRMASFCRGGG